ncbi:MAG: hypothetical protein GXP45_02605 [bacterium]|nr:hypothetical protein [bacterium]
MMQKSKRNLIISKIEEDIERLQLAKSHPKLQKEEEQKEIDVIILKLLTIQRLITHIP